MVHGFCHTTCVPENFHSLFSLLKIIVFRSRYDARRRPRRSFFGRGVFRGKALSPLGLRARSFAGKFRRVNPPCVPAMHRLCAATDKPPLIPRRAPLSLGFPFRRDVFSAARVTCMSLRGGGGGRTERGEASFVKFRRRNILCASGEERVRGSTSGRSFGYPVAVAAA